MPSAGHREAYVQGPVARLRAVGGLAMPDSLSYSGRPMANSPPGNVEDRYLGWVMPLAYCCPELTEGAIVTLKSAVHSSLRTMHHKPQKPPDSQARDTPATSPYSHPLPAAPRPAQDISTLSGPASCVWGANFDARTL